MKKFFVIVVSIAFSGLLFAQDIDKSTNDCRFFGELGMGISVCTGNSNLYTIDGKTAPLSSNVTMATFGMQQGKNLFALDCTMIPLAEIEVDDDLRYSTSIVGLGLLWERRYDFTPTFFVQSNIGAGLLMSGAAYEYVGKDLDDVCRYGSYLKLGMGLGFDIGRLSTVGFNANMFLGDVQDKDLPKEIHNVYDENEGGLVSSIQLSFYYRIKI